MSRRVDITFRTGRFNLSEVGAHFVNPCCFGEDFVRWLVKELEGAGYDTGTVGQEDWGWYARVKRTDSYLVGASGNAHEEPERPDFGTWRVILEKSWRLRGILRGSNALQAGDALVLEVERILRAQPDFEGVERES